MPNFSDVKFPPLLARLARLMPITNGQFSFADELT